MKTKGEYLLIEKLLGFLLIFSTVAIALISFGITGLGSIAFNGAVLLTFVLFFLVVGSNIENPKISSLVLLFSAIVGFTIISVVQNANSLLALLNFNYIKNAFLYLAVCAFFVMVVYIKIPLKVVKMTSICSMGLIYVYFYLSFFQASYRAQTLIFEFNNPNTAGMFIFVLFSYVMIGLKIFTESKAIKLLLWITAVVSLYLINLTMARASFLAALIVLVVFFISNKKRFINKYINYINFLALSIPLIIVFVYSLLYNILPADTIVLSKYLFSGREVAWVEIMLNAIKHPFASYYNVNIARLLDLKASGHNIYVHVVQSFGLYGLVTMFVLLWKTTKKAVMEAKDEIAYLSIIIFYAIMFQQSFEGTLIGGSMGFYIPMLSFLAIRK